MIKKITQVMVYVENQEEALRFWTAKVGFVVKQDLTTVHGMRIIEVAPTVDAQTSIVLHDKELVAKFSPEVNLGTPSILFATEEIEAMRERLQENNVKVGEIVEMPTGKVFNFADEEQQYFAIIQTN